MVRHIVFWKLKENAEGNDKLKNAEIIKEKLEALNGKITELWAKTLNNHSHLESKLQSAIAQVVVDGRQHSESAS